MPKQNTDTSLRIDIKTRENLDVIAQREGIPIKKCVLHMTEFFIKNSIGVKDDFVSFDKVGDRIIRILKSQEKNYFVPLMTGVNRISVFQDRLIVDAENSVNNEQPELPEEPITEVPKMQFPESAISPDRERLEKLQTSNMLLKQKLSELIDESKLTVKSGVNIDYYVMKLTKQELEDIRRTIQVCTIQ